MQSHFKVFGEGLQSFREQVDRRFDQVDGRLDKVEGRLDRVEGQLDKVEGRLDRVEHEIVLLKDVGVENTRGLKEVRSAVDRLMVLRAFPFRG
jgi:chromosome segregation ATPase